ncbi:MAG: hypothetical protein KAJ57_06205, partial [Woeseiaceae bacterium]|nr:hypothetical protein [Woeseiaceae bacterium]
MSKGRLIAILLGVSAAGLLASLILLMPVGSAKQIVAITLFGAVVLLYLLHVRADTDALRQLGNANRDLETRLGGLRQSLSERATPLYSESGELTGAVEVLHKLNDQERLALKLRRAKEDAET